MNIFNKHSAEILLLLFFIITYFMSVLEKLGDWKGTIVYYKNHFIETILFKMIPLLLVKIIIFEIGVLLLLSIGLYNLVVENETTVAVIGLELSAITLLMFLFGQRLAKDYPGAINITVYFILNIFGIYLLT